MKRKNWSAYFYVYKMQILKSMAYKFDVYGNIVMQTMVMMASAFFWKALFKNADNMAGVTVDTMLAYTVLSSMISVLLTSKVEWRITDCVRKGTIAIDMMRPVNIFKVFFAENLGGVTALIFQNLLPVFIIGSLMIKMPVPSSVTDVLLFLVSMLLAFFINWDLAVIFGIGAFKVIEMNALIQVKKHFIRLLSGSIIPIWFFPDCLRNVLEYLPFIYIYQMPMSIYLGKHSWESLKKGLFLQLFWVLILGMLKRYLENRVTQYLRIQGG